MWDSMFPTHIPVSSHRPLHHLYLKGFYRFHEHCRDLLKHAFQLGTHQPRPQHRGCSCHLRSHRLTGALKERSGSCFDHGQNIAAGEVFLGVCIQ